jgi:hypothetical protein
MSAPALLWLVALLLGLSGCASTPDHLLTYPAQGVVIQADRLVAPFFGRAADPLPYGGPDIDQPLRRMHERFVQLKPELDSGTLGLTDEGEVAIREAAAETPELGLLVCAENKDRAILYRAMSTAVGYSEGIYVPYVEASFASEWQKQAPAGWWLRDDRGQWSQKASPFVPFARTRVLADAKLRVLAICFLS